MKTPTIKELAIVFGDNAEHAKDILEQTGGHWQLAMNALDRVANTHGVQTIALGKGDFVDYLNTGDPYDPTLYHIRGNYYVGAWGDLVERHGSMDLQEAIAKNGFRQH